MTVLIPDHCRSIYFSYNSRGAWHTVLREMLPEIQTIEKYDFL